MLNASQTKSTRMFNGPVILGTALVVAGMAISGCGTTRGERALSGGAIGAGVGAAGAAITGGSVGGGAVLGGAVGAATGALTDKSDINLGD